MALGYAQSTGKPSAFSVVPGPGVMNTMGALLTSWGVNAPVMCITGQVPSAMIGRGRGQLHEMPDQLATLKSMPQYVEWFKAAFPGEEDPVTFDNFAKAIEAFEATLITPAPFDAFLTLRGIRTLHARMAVHEANAHAVVDALVARERIERLQRTPLGHFQLFLKGLNGDALIVSRRHVAGVRKMMQQL